jgi:serine/threonine protein kinase
VLFPGRSGIRLGREVALKMLRGDRREDPDLRARFEREARMVATLAHPNICTLFDVGEPVDPRPGAVIAVAFGWRSAIGGTKGTDSG